MQLTDTGESRVRGYLYVLDRSLRTFLPKETVADAVREIESHIRDRVTMVEGVPDERTALERILGELGPPLRVAQAYSAEMTLDEAVTTGRFVPIVRSLSHIAMTSVVGFIWFLVLFVGYVAGLAFAAIGILKPIFPGNVGFVWKNGMLVGFGAQFPVEPGQVVTGGYWLIPIVIAIGLAILLGTHRAARHLVAGYRLKRQLKAESRT